MIFVLAGVLLLLIPLLVLSRSSGKSPAPKPRRPKATTEAPAPLAPNKTERARLSAEEREELEAGARDLAAGDPAHVANLLRDWMKEGPRDSR